MSFYVKKASGEKELFDPEKFKTSLRRAGANQEIIDEIIQELEKQPAMRSTKKIYRFAHDYLESHKPALAARYSIKHALFDLGPAGYPFEQFIGHLFERQGYKVTTNKLMSGFCVEHEIDVLAIKDSMQYIIECKFHQRQNYKSDIKIPLYVKARFDDIIEALSQKKTSIPFQPYIVTNTKFTTEAIKFAECRNIKLLDWSYPYGESLPVLIDKYKLHPITALSSLSQNQKSALIKQGVILCKDAAKHQQVFSRIGLSAQKARKIIAEAQEVCEI